MLIFDKIILDLLAFNLGANLVTIEYLMKVNSLDVCINHLELIF